MNARSKAPLASVRNMTALGGLAASACLAACSGRTAEAEAAHFLRVGQDLSELSEMSGNIQIEVSELRGLEFVADVPVEIADRDAFEAYVAERMEAIGDEQQRQDQELIIKLLGLVPADMDFWGESLEMLGGQVGGYYDQDRGTFSIMEGVTGGLARSTLSHELVHALDDQHFDLGGQLEALADNADRLGAYHAVVEGSAMLVQNVWTATHVGEFTPADIEAMSNATPTELFEAPAYVWLPLLFSYYRGQCFLQRTESLAEAMTKPVTTADVNQAFRNPPRSTEQILHPHKYWDADRVDEPVTVNITALEIEGQSPWQAIHSEVLGELGLYMLSAGEGAIVAPDLSDAESFLQLPFSSEAAAGWEGDRAVLFERAGSYVLVVATLWETEKDRDEFANSAGLSGGRLSDAAAAVAQELDLGVHMTLRNPAGEREFHMFIGIGPVAVGPMPSWFDIDIEQ